MNYIQHFILTQKPYYQAITKILRSITPRASKQELIKIIPVFSLFFFISFVFHLLHCLKKTLILKASGGAEVIPFIQVWLVMPSSILFTWAYMRLAKKPNRQPLIYCTLGLFGVFFTIFMIFLYPYKDQLYLTNLATILKQQLPDNLSYITQVIRYWPEALFYVMSEMWSIIVLSILFWGFCNETTKLEEAKRFYAIIALGANCAGILSGQFMQIISKYFSSSWSQSITIFLSSLIISCILITFIFIKINNRQNLDKNSMQEDTNLNIKASDHNKHKVAFSESIKYIIRYKYITLLAIMVIGYNMVFNLADLVWLDQINRRFSSPDELNNYLAQLDFLIGVFSLIIGLFVFSNIINKFGWKITALIPPIVWLISSIFLYTALFAEKFGFNLNTLILILGTLQISTGKAVKYCIFDQVKEITFIPLSIEQQKNSKAVIDGIISRIGKSGGSIIIQGFLIFGIGEIIAITPVITISIIITIFVWIYATNKLGKLMTTEQYLN